ncbi:MAG TPA: AAA family ATPase, partial [Candidatus Ozemobacteraceae bacterium]|nr:AAA family ATPase [Candidatus Ozemobacteraceae bacterium]
MSEDSLTTILDTSQPAYSLANELVRLCPELSTREHTGAVALLMAVIAAEHEGHTYLSLNSDDGSGSLSHTVPLILTSDAPREAMSEITRQAADLASSQKLRPLIGSAGEHRPLILEGDTLATHRSSLQEAQLNHLLRQRLYLPDFDVCLPASSEMFPPSQPGLTTEQAAAVTRALQRRLTVISGGPGTGKTTIVAALIASLCRLGVSPRDIGLAAPTGKAANRLEESISRSLTHLETVTTEAERTALSGVTLHRLLGVGSRQGRPAFHAGNPLPLRAVIVDEASMIDLSLMHQLLEALLPDCRLVLLGDADQLPAVENGAVFRDLVSPQDSQMTTPNWCCRLTQSFRMREEDPDGSAILRLATRIRLSDAGSGTESSSPDRLLPVRPHCSALNGRGPE